MVSIRLDGMGRVKTSHLLFVVLSLLALGATQGGRNTRNRRQKGRGSRGSNRCRIVGCARCSRTNATQCEVCRTGFAITDDEQCAACSFGCRTCEVAGHGNCDSCKQGFMLDPVTKGCGACSPHCLQCDEAGPGGCNECGTRRMLHVRLELSGEIHECLPCGDGCKECTYEGGCHTCDSFFVPLPHGTGCTFSYVRVFALVAVVVLGVVLCIFALDPSVETGSTFYDRPPPQKPKDVAQAVRPQNDKALRRRGTDRPDTSPPRESTYTGSLAPGYSGIEIVDDKSLSARDR